MKTLNFKITNIKAIDSYLYAGNMYVFFESGRIAYVSFSYMVHLLQDDYPQYRNLFELAFLHNDYVNSAPGRLILGMNGVRPQILKEWDKARKEVSFAIPYERISRYFHELGEWVSIPLDVRIYAMRVYLGCENGLYENIISQDEKAKVTLHSSDRVFDSKVVSVNARYGTIAISADGEGLFSSSIIEENHHIQVLDNPDVNGISLRTDWKDTDLLSYDGESRFLYIHNQSERAQRDTPNYRNLRKAGDYRHITDFAIQVDEMDPLLNELEIEYENLSYCFNSGSSAFLKLKDGTFFATDFKQRSGGTYKKVIKEEKGCKRIMSSAIIPGGCVLRYHDKSVIYKDGTSLMMYDGPTYGIRSYINSNQYRSLVTVNTEESILIHSTEMFDPIAPVQEDMQQYGRVRYSNMFRLRRPDRNIPNPNDEDLPF